MQRNGTKRPTPKGSCDTRNAQDAPKAANRRNHRNHSSGLEVAITASAEMASSDYVGSLTRPERPEPPRRTAVNPKPKRTHPNTQKIKVRLKPKIKINPSPEPRRATGTQQRPTQPFGSKADTPTPDRNRPRAQHQLQTQDLPLPRFRQPPPRPVDTVSQHRATVASLPRELVGKVQEQPSPSWPAARGEGPGTALPQLARSSWGRST